VIKNNGDGLVIDAENPPSRVSAIGFLNVYIVVHLMMIDYLVGNDEQCVLVVHSCNI
jgi:hypothetical protein